MTKSTIINFIKKHKVQLLILAVFLACYAVFVYAQRHFITHDTAIMQVMWWGYIAENGWQGIATLNAAGLGDYTTIWYFVIAIFTQLGIYPEYPLEYSLKFLAVATSLLSALAVYLIAKHFHPNARYLPILAGCVTPFLPLFSMDLLKTNLTDGMYIMPSLWSFYFFLKNKKEVSWFLLAVAACFKLMAVYLLPVYLFFYLKDFKKYSLRNRLAPLWGLAAILVCSMPNMIMGGKFVDGIIMPIIERNDVAVVMPWFWLIPIQNEFTTGDTAQQMRVMLYGLLFLALFVTIFFILTYIKKSNQVKIGMAIFPALSIMICFYLLPSQHETYFAMAAVFALIGYLILPCRELLINFLAINIFLFYMYLFGITWWYEEPVWVLPKAVMGVIFVSLLIYNYYILYKHSSFYRPRQKV